MEHLLNTIHHADCFDLLAMIPDGAVDAVITDLPYGTTACHWDTIIPFEPMWVAVKRVLKPRGVFVTTASQPFTSALVMSNPKWFRCEWIWQKNQATGMMNARYKPLKEHENIIVFSAAVSRSNQFTDYKHTYNPQGLEVKPTREKSKTQVTAINNLRGIKPGYYIREETNFPKTILSFDVDTGLHPTQKPAALYEYLIRTYTQADDVVLDFCCGSGTTAVAARNTGRRFIAGDSSPEYVAIARDRLRMPFEPREIEPKSAPLEELPLFAAGD